MTRYKFKCALGAFFEIDSAIAEKLIPSNLNLLELRPGCAVLNIAAFDFIESEVGSYGEIVLSIAVTPYSTPSDRLPHIALFPFQLGTSTQSSIEHGRQRWKLPAYPKVLDIAFDETNSCKSVTVKENGTNVLQLDVLKTNKTKQISRIYQCFTQDAKLHRVNIEICGEIDEHEEESSALKFSNHPFCNLIDLDNDIPFREQSMGQGEQHFSELTGVYAN